MIVRSHTPYFAAFLMLCGTALAQNPGGSPGQTTNPQPTTPGSPGSMPGTPSTGPAAYPYPGATPADTPMPRVNDKTFVKKAAEGGLAEVELGKLAQEKGSNEAVKEFGKLMVEDHSKANEELQSVASKANVDVPSDLSRSGKKNRDKLAKLSGPDFDRAYAKMMVSDHKEDVASFQEEAQAGQVADVKHFAAKELPTLQEHEKLAENMQSTVNKK